MKIEEISKLDIRKVSMLMLIWISGVCAGWFLFITFGNACDLCKVLYVSKNEILRLEKGRVEELNKVRANENINAKTHLFNGKVNEAIREIFEISKMQEDGNTKVLFIDNEEVKGSNKNSKVVSISKQVLDVVKSRVMR